MDVSGQRRAPAALSQGKNRRTELIGGLFRSQNRPGILEKK